MIMSVCLWVPVLQMSWNVTAGQHKGTDRPKARRRLHFWAAVWNVKKKKQKITPSAEPSEDIQLFCWSSLHGGLRARTSVPCKGCSSQATAELPWASWGDQERCVCLPVRVHVCKGVMKYYVSCSSTHWLPYPICSARLSVPNKREPVGTSPSDSVSHTYVCDTFYRQRYATCLWTFVCKINYDYFFTGLCGICVCMCMKPGLLKYDIYECKVLIEYTVWLSPIFALFLFARRVFWYDGGSTEAVSWKRNWTGKLFNDNRGCICAYLIHSITSKQ